MTTLLRIDASMREEGSSTRAVTDHFEQRWLQAHPEGRVIRRCLASEPIPHLTQRELEAFRDDDTGPATFSKVLVEELRRADHVLIGSPLYNLSLPSALKAYFDHVVRAGATFEAEDGEYRGLLEGKRGVVVTARGGPSTPGHVDDFQTAYLREILAFIGISEVDHVALEGTAIDAASRQTALARGRAQIDHWFDGSVEPVWMGDIGEEDRRQIARLRDGQSRAILEGDAEAYAALCTDDVRLLVPGHDVVAGRPELRSVEEAFFDRTRFVGFRKFPLSLEASGNMAIEVGRQEVEVHQDDGSGSGSGNGLGNGSGGILSASQKYTHVFRRTAEGWRFAVLMSNPSE